MNFKVQIKNYQIIKDVSLEFIPGLNVIIGPSNNGKSSILKAIKALIYTVPGTTPIRNGQSFYAVGISYNNHTIILQKGLKESVYIVDGEKYTKYGVNTPEIVSKSLNIKELVLNGNKEQLNFWDQMEYPFLINRTSTELFKFIIDSSDSDQVSQSLKDMVSDRQQLNKEIDLLQGTINTIDLDIDSYTNTLDKSKSIIEACNSIIELQPKVSKLNQLKQIKEIHETNKNELNNLNTELYNKQTETTLHKKYYTNIYSKNSTLQVLNNKFIQLHNLIEDLSNNNEDILKLSKLRNLKQLDNSKLNQLKQIKNQLDLIKNQISNMKPIKIVKLNLSEQSLIRLNKLKQIRKNHINNDYKMINLVASKQTTVGHLDLLKETKEFFDICPLCGHKLHGKEC